MLKIRLQRVGRIHEPSFRLVLTDSKNSTKSGKCLENLGNFDARRGEKSEFKADRIKHWMSVGAQVTPTVHNLLVEKKIIEGKKINVLPLKRPIAPTPEGVGEPTASVGSEESAPISEILAESVAEEAPVQDLGPLPTEAAAQEEGATEETPEESPKRSFSGILIGLIIAVLLVGLVWLAIAKHKG